MKCVRLLTKFNKFIFLFFSSNFRLSDELNSNLAQDLLNKSTAANTSFDNANLSRLINDSNWLLNNQLNSQLNSQLNQLNYSSTSHPSVAHKNQFNQLNNLNNLNKRNKLINSNNAGAGGSNNKNFVYSDKNAVDSVKKLDKIISNHNRNLQEIIKHKNQLIKTITAKQAYTSSNSNGRQTVDHYLPSSQFNNNSNATSQLNNQLSNQCNKLIQQTNHLVNSQANNQFSSLFTNSQQPKSQINFQSIEFLNNNNKINNKSSQLNSSNFSNNLLNSLSYQLNQNKLNANKRLSKTVSKNEANDNGTNGLNNSLNVLTRAINEEAELNKQKLASQKRSTTNDHELIRNELNSNDMISALDLIPINTSSTNKSVSQQSNPSIKLSNSNLKTVAQTTTKQQSSNQISLTTNLKRKLVSKLDERERRLKRFKEDEFESDIFYIDNGDEWCLENGDEIAEALSDCEFDDEYEYRLKANCIIFKHSRDFKSLHKLSKGKLDYLHRIGLTTEQNKERIEFNKFVRTKRTLKEISNVNCGAANDLKATSNLRNQTLRSQSLRNQTLKNQALKSDTMRNITQSINLSTAAELSRSLVSSPLSQLSINKLTDKLSDDSKDIIFKEFIQTIFKRKIDKTHLEPTKGK